MTDTDHGAAGRHRITAAGQPSRRLGKRYGANLASRARPAGEQLHLNLPIARTQ
jgi:hypothetical protein